MAEGAHYPDGLAAEVPAVPGGAGGHASPEPAGGGWGPGGAEAALRAAVADSFERITVDGQMSTNDTVLLQATGSSGQGLPEGLLDAVLLQLALEVVADGEGATRVGRIEVSGAASSDEAE